MGWGVHHEVVGASGLAHPDALLLERQLGMILAKRELARSSQKVDEHVPVEVTDEPARCLVDGDRNVPRVDPGVRLPPILSGRELGRTRPWKRASDSCANRYVDVFARVHCDPRSRRPDAAFGSGFGSAECARNASTTRWSAPPDGWGEPHP
jgi:hypothetical protein